MRQASFTDGMYLNAAGVNLAPTDSWRSAQEAAGVWAFPGLIHPEATSWSCSGLSVTGVFNTPSAFQFASGSSNGSSGVVAFAHGTTAGADTKTYVTSLASLVPGAGTQTVFLVATYAQVLQTPTAVVGPPQGNPAFNPNFVAFNAYTEAVDTIAVAAVTGVPDGLTTLELARTTLTAGQSSINLAQLDFSHQQMAARVPTVPIAAIVGTVTLTPSQAGILFNIAVSGATINLPAAGTWPGRPFKFYNSANAFSTIVTNGADNIAGIAGAGQTTTSLAVRPGSYVELLSHGTGTIQAISTQGSIPITWPVSSTPDTNMTYDTTSSLTVPNQIASTVGNISSNAGHIIAALGARGFGVGQICTNLNDFPFVVDSGGDYRVGYCILPNNVIIQWGVGLMTGLTQVFAFPIAFPTACASLIPSEENPGTSWAAGNPTLYAKAEEVDTTFFTMFGLFWVGAGWSGFNSGANKGAFRYIAVGY